MNLIKLLNILPCQFLLRCVFLLFIFSYPVSAFELKVAVASNFNHTMKALVAEFEKAYPHKVKVSFGSSGKIYAQIIHGAPFDVFFSADQDKPNRLRNANMVVNRSQFTYAQGQLVLWSNNRNGLQQPVQILQQGRYQTLAMANAKLAPYGMAAKQVLEKLGVSSSKRHTWVQGENISQTFQFVRSKNVDLGFVALSQVRMLDQSEDSYWLIPQAMYLPILQDAVILTRAKHNSVAVDFVSFIQQPIGQQIIRSHGYLLGPAQQALVSDKSLHTLEAL